MKRVLFVDDEQLVLNGLRRLLYPMRGIWEVAFASGGQEALAELEKMEYDVVVSDMRMPRVDGAALLAAVKARWPGTVRIVLSGEADRETAMRTVRVAHQFLAKPCDSAVLRQVIDRSCGLREILDDDALRGIVGGVDSLPGMPRVYSALELALVKPNPRVTDIAGIIRQDMAITAKLLQLCNSSFFGLKREIAEIEQAINYLGLSVVRSLVLSHEIADSMGRGMPAGFNAEQYQNHSLLTATIARRLPLPRQLADEAFMAGMLHDLGKLLIATRAPDRFREAKEVALRDAVPLHVAERALFGATHAEAGAVLLAMWGLPDSIVGGVAHHHEPGRSASADLDIIAAVHIANDIALDVAGRPASDDVEPRRSRIDDDFVRHIGCADQLEAWRQEARDNLATGTV